MTFYALVLFIHVVAVLALFAVMSFEILSLTRLRQASSLPEARLWIEPVRGLPSVAMGSLLVILISGIYLAMRMSAFEVMAQGDCNGSPPDRSPRCYHGPAYA